MSGFRCFYDADRSCFGHALEVGKPGQTVTWANEETGVQYEMVPGATSDEYADTCREYTLRAITGDRNSFRQGTACETEPGVWNVVKSSENLTSLYLRGQFRRDFI